MDLMTRVFFPSHLGKGNHFVGSSPTGGDIFFLKSDLNWPYFTISNILESHIINLKPQN